MGRRTKHKLDAVLEAIKGTGGVKLHICTKLDITYPTLEHYLKKWVKARQAYDDELKTPLDLAKFNVRRALVQGDVATSKWYLYHYDPDQLRHAKGGGVSETLVIVDQASYDLV